ncbi:hypothetical protein [Enterococcus faecium]|uniref:hypothetical protein n=1 Tax=Enterococcus faecium TaxID=1352 RepID=UPI0022011598|nr:hypothetical protein [Enterococcus faecium]BDP47350.1 hypothetical protein EfmJHP9_22200 [Enterococcus faecium]
MNEVIDLEEYKKDREALMKELNEIEVEPAKIDIKNVTNAKRDYIFKGLLKCSDCQGSVAGQTIKARYKKIQMAI